MRIVLTAPPHLSICVLLTHLLLSLQIYCCVQINSVLFSSAYSLMRGDLCRKQTFTVTVIHYCTEDRQLLIAQNRDLCVSHLHSTPPLWGVPVGILPWRLVRKNWNGLATRWWKKFWRYVYSFRQTPRTWRTDRQTDGRTTPRDGIGRAYA